MTSRVFSLHRHPEMVQKALEADPDLFSFWMFLSSLPQLRFRVAVDEPGAPSPEYIRRTVRVAMNAAISEDCYEMPKPH